MYSQRNDMSYNDVMEDKPLELLSQKFEREETIDVPVVLCFIFGRSTG